MAKDKKSRKITDFEIGDPRRFFCDRVFVLYGEEHFVLGIQTGAVIDAQYAFTPKHAKRLLKRLEQKIKEYEEKYGELNVTLPTEE